ncbi:3'-5' exonuclease [Ruficoccus amylovorans]|uniref:3'-5' exonuclease n=1 Tax=Ruficoccus amylovorans TaxID=1804625 RepID=A0A842HBU6_9BACT|nr:3'-5' exonuclease [Ruficoccus amylovorans]MBC2593730.1 3'-5' exonuclease [Ruficoccus amylovorans]
MNLFGDSDDIQLYHESFEQTWSDSDPMDHVRFVVLDTETTGLNARKDGIVSIGAVAVRRGQIMLEDQYEAMIKFAYNTSAVVVHGVTREVAQEDGLEEPVALREFLAYLRDGVIVGHHIGFDVEILGERCWQRFGLKLQNRWIDTMELTLRLEDLGAFPEEEHLKKDFSLDGLCRRFGVKPHDRHTAPGDAFITAQIFLKLLRLARRYNIQTLAELSERWQPPEERT